MTVFGLEQLTLYSKTSLIIYVKDNKQMKIFRLCPLDGAERSNKGSFDWIWMIGHDTFGKSNVI